jgi:hypothetical protein
MPKLQPAVNGTEQRLDKIIEILLEQTVLLEALLEQTAPPPIVVNTAATKRK